MSESRSFGLVDDKVAEADFFLGKLQETDFNFFEARCYFSAFVPAARSITFALQAVMSEVEGFEEWYREKQDVLKENRTARFFQKVRTETQHIGDTPLKAGAGGRGPSGKSEVKYFFSSGRIGEPLEDAPGTDVVTACRTYLTLLLEILFECYKRFGTVIDPDQYYTVENLQQAGVTIEDIEESLGFPRGWTAVPPAPDEIRLQALRRHIPGSHIDVFFEKYLNKTRFQGPITDTK